MAKRAPEDIKRDRLSDIYEQQRKQDELRNDLSKSQKQRENAEKKYQALLKEEFAILDQLAKLREREERSLDSITRKLQDQIRSLKDKEDLSKAENSLLSEADELQKQISKEIENGTANTQELVDKFELLKQKIKQVTKEELKATQAADKFLGDVTSGLEKIPILGSALTKGLKAYLKSPKGKELSKEFAKRMFDKKAVGKSLGASIGMVGMAAGVALTDAGVKLMVKQSEIMKDIRRTLGLTNVEAKEFREMSKDMLSDSNSMATTQKEILEAASQLSNTYGTTVKNNQKLVNSQITLTKGFGLQAEDAEKINMLADATGQDYEKQLQATVATAQATGKVYKFSFNTNKIFEDVAKLSASIQASFKGSTAAMSKAVIQTKLMGTTLTQLDAAADNLLQIESSIENQVTAQLVTGRNINLDKARMYALNNDLVKVGQELVNQGIDYAAFSEMNRVEMQATAAAMGMQKDELAEMLLKQEVYKRAGANIRATDAETLKLNEEKIKMLAEQGDEEAKKYIDSQKQLSIQERMTAAMERFSAVMETIYYVIVGIGIALAVASAIMTFGASIPFLAGLGTAGAVTTGIGAGILGGVAAKHMPVMADGGFIPYKPGGTNVTMSEQPGSKGEVIVPLKKYDNMVLASSGMGSNSQLNTVTGGSNKETNDLLRQLITKVDQPPVISFNGTTINEMGKMSSLNKNYQVGVGNSYNRIGVPS
jgi:hypothetical protein